MGKVCGERRGGDRDGERVERGVRGEGVGEYVERGVRGREMECVGSGVRQMGVWEWSEAEGE